MTKAVPSAYAPNDYHRHMVSLYYASLITRFGLAAMLRRVRALRGIVWTPRGLDRVCERVFVAMEGWHA